MATTINTATSRTPLTSLVGRRAIAETENGPMVGTLEMPGKFSGVHMRVRFDDGRWAHAGIVIHLAD